MQNEVLFTDLNSQKILQLEVDLAYFFGAKNPDPIARHYMQAIKQLEYIGLQGGRDKLHTAMVKPLRSAYQEIQNQTKLEFNVNKVCEYEFELILAQSQKAPFEEIYRIMTHLYGEVFNSSRPNISEAALLRTFLYKYKISILNAPGPLSEADIKLMIDIAKLSEKKLNGIASHDPICE